MSKIKCNCPCHQDSNFKHVKPCCVNGYIEFPEPIKESSTPSPQGGDKQGKGLRPDATNYVCGFYFDHRHKQVVLIWKNKPKWQAGHLNGVGGKIDAGESPAQAMRREFKEETGIDHEIWHDLITLYGPDWRVYFFYTVGKVKEFEYAETQETEEVAKIDVDRLDDFKHISNLRWLIPLALYKLRFPEETISVQETSSRGSISDLQFTPMEPRLEKAAILLTKQEGEPEPVPIQQETDHIHVSLPSGGVARVSPDASPELLGALDKMVELAKEMPEKEVPKMNDELASQSDIAALEYGKSNGVQMLTEDYDNSTDITTAFEAGQSWMYHKLQEQITKLNKEAQAYYNTAAANHDMLQAAKEEIEEYRKALEDMSATLGPSSIRRKQMKALLTKYPKGNPSHIGEKCAEAMSFSKNCPGILRAMIWEDVDMK